MRKMLTVARREYNARSESKAFLVSLFLMPLLMGGGVLVQLLLKDQVDTQEKRFAIVDRTPERQLVAGSTAAAAHAKRPRDLRSTTGKQVKPVFSIEQVPASADSARHH